MGLFGKKKKEVDPKFIEINEILAQSLVHSKVPEGVDKETYDLIGRIVFHANTYAEELKKGMGFVSIGHVKKFVSKEYDWINKDNLERLGSRAVDRLK